MAIFAQPTPDMNLVPGWDVQGNGSAGEAGPDAPGYGQAGNTGTVYGPGQTGAGFPNPPGAENVGGENSGSYSTSILANPGYADATGPGGRTLPANIGGATVNAPAVPASGVVAANPTNLVATVVVASGTLTVVKVGSANQTYAQATQVGTADGTYTVPPGGVIGITYSVAPTWTWSV
jgi:hypothetical protein